MGLLNLIAEGRNSSSIAPMNDQFNPNKMRTRFVDKTANILDEGIDYYKGHINVRERFSKLAEMFESDDEDTRWKAALTLDALQKQANFLNGQVAVMGEATVQSSLGTLNPRILDVVRIFYPNQVAPDLVDFQPVDGQVAQIFTMKPRYTDAVAGVSAGNEVFRTLPTHHNYASELNVASLGTGDGTATTFTIANLGTVVPVRKGSFVVKNAGVVVGADDSNGKIVGAGLGTATINYSTGATSVTFSVAPANGAALTVEYYYDSETTTSLVRKLDFDIGLVPVTCKAFPVQIDWSVQAGLAANAHLAVDVQDTLAELGAQFIKIERDNRLIHMINQNAQTASSLNFDATPSTYYDRRAKYSEIELKIDEAMSLIQGANGRGAVDWVLCGKNAANIFSNCPTFRAEAVGAPIGAHRIGTLRDGTIKVIKSLTLDTNTFIFGYKGYVAGDSAMILAEWIPLYFTPVFQAPTMRNSQGIMSMYDMFVNNALYYYKGTVSNYVA